MTVAEYRTALSQLTPDQFRTFRERWGGTSDTIEKCVQDFAYHKEREQWEQIIVFHLRNLGTTTLRTEREKDVDRAERTAAAAAASAAAAEISARAAASSNRAAWWSQIIALLAIIATLTLERCS